MVVQMTGEAHAAIPRQLDVVTRGGTKYGPVTISAFGIPRANRSIVRPRDNLNRVSEKKKKIVRTLVVSEENFAAKTFPE
jgi:hypothetical protein